MSLCNLIGSLDPSSLLPIGETMTLVYLLTDAQTRGAPLGRRIVPTLVARAYFAWHDARGTISPRYVDLYTEQERIADMTYSLR